MSPHNLPVIDSPKIINTFQSLALNNYTPLLHTQVIPTSHRCFSRTLVKYTRPLKPHRKETQRKLLRSPSTTADTNIHGHYRILIR